MYKLQSAGIEVYSAAASAAVPTPALINALETHTTMSARITHWQSRVYSRAIVRKRSLVGFIAPADDTRSQQESVELCSVPYRLYKFVRRFYQASRYFLRRLQ